MINNIASESVLIHVSFTAIQTLGWELTTSPMPRGMIYSK